MSRTYRRKGLKQRPSKYKLTMFSLGGIAQDYWVPPTPVEEVKAERRFHSDKRHYGGPAPLAYRKMFVRRDRRRQNRALESALRWDSLDNMVIEHRHRHSATWAYW